MGKKSSCRVIWLKKIPFRLAGMFHLVIVWLAVIACVFARQPEEPAPIRVRDNQNYDGKALTVPMSAESGVAMYQRWMEQAFSGLFTAVALKRIPHLDPKKRKELAACSRQSYDVIQHANCLKDILTPMETTTEIRTMKAVPKPRIVSHSSFVIDSSDNQEVTTYRKDSASRRLTKYSTLPRKVVHRRRKRDDSGVNDKNTPKPASRASYALKDGRPYTGFSPLGSVAKFLTATILKSKNKTRTDDWEVTINRLQKIVLKRKQEKKDRERRRFQAAGALDGEYEPFRGLKEKEVDEMSDAFQDPKQLGNFLTAAKRQRQVNRADVASRVSDLVREGVKVGFAMAGDNTTDFDRKTLKLVSPRFLSVVPEEVDDDNSTLNLLSPSLFSMHDKGHGLEKSTSITSLSKDISNGDRSAWLNLVMEAAGVSEHVDKLEQTSDSSEEIPASITPGMLQKARENYETEARGEDGQPLYFTKENVTERFGDFEKRKIETFETLIKTYSPQQLAELNTTGYALLTKDQLLLVYGPQSPYNDSRTLKCLLPLDNDTLHEGIERDIVRTAEMKSFQIRQKDVVLSPRVLSPLVNAWPALNQPIILSPLVLSPIVLTPSVLGPAILSPYVFSPVILSPRVLAPLILSPLVFVPVILSPIVLHPIILTPGVFVPFILSPFVISPLIFSPQVFMPLILSPMVLSPLILNPMVGSPLILSPFVLNPLILSPQAFFAVVLSPYALSPLIASKLIASALVLSPSWLS